jgi:hypothetical protein
MNISNWGIGRIMQLPDWCFGRRWCVSLAYYRVSGQVVWDISEIGLGDKAVLWNVAIRHNDYSEMSDYLRLALSDQLPANAGEMDVLEPLIPGLGFQGAEPRRIYLGRPSTAIDIPLRMPIDAQGRRPVLEVASAAMESFSVLVALTVSSVPTEVPDWLVSV